MQQIFEENSFSRTNSNGTYRGVGQTRTMEIVKKPSLLPQPSGLPQWNLKPFFYSKFKIIFLQKTQHSFRIFSNTYSIR